MEKLMERNQILSDRRRKLRANMSELDSLLYVSYKFSSSHECAFVSVCLSRQFHSLFIQHATNSS